MHIKLVAMVTGDKISNYGTQLFIAFTNSFMLCKYHLHTVHKSSMLRIFERKIGFYLRKNSVILGVGVRNIL